MDKDIADLNQQLDAVADSQRMLIDLQMETVRFLQLFQREQRAALAGVLGAATAKNAGENIGNAHVAPPVTPTPSPVIGRPAPAAVTSVPAEAASATSAPAVVTWAQMIAAVPQAPAAMAPVEPVAKIGIDIVVPVHNSLHHARLCIESVFRHATAPFTLTIVDDCSDSHTKAELDRLVEGHGDVRVIHHETNAGYLSSVNEAIAATRSQVCLLLNSDAMLAPGACDRLRESFASDARIGVVTAVSTWANWTKIPFPKGTNYLDLQDYIAGDGDSAIADIGNASGFFFAVRRSLFDELGLFDKAYHPGYWEEADFCMAAMKAGYRVTVDLRLYIYHHGWGSFQKSGRDEHMTRNRHVFMARWQAPYAELERRWRHGNPVSSLAARIGAASRLRTGGQPRVLFISAGAGIDDDSVALMQLANALVNRGISANVFYAGAVDDRLFDMTPMYFRPLAGRPDVEDLKSYDIYVATSQATAMAAQKLATCSAKTVAFGFAFNVAERPNGMRAILRGTGAGASAEDVVALSGVNLDIFYPRDGKRDTHILSRVTQAAWDKHASAIVAFHEKLASAYPHVTTAIIGPAEIVARLPSAGHRGEPHRMQQRAEILSQAGMVIDWDGTQGGRMAFLEAAACGAVPVILAELGEGQASAEMDHCVMANRSDVDALAQQLATLAGEPERLGLLAGNARKLAMGNALRDESETLATAFRGALGQVELPAPGEKTMDNVRALRAS